MHRKFSRKLSLWPTLATTIGWACSIAKSRTHTRIREHKAGLRPRLSSKFRSCQSGHRSWPTVDKSASRGSLGDDTLRPTRKPIGGHFCGERNANSYQARLAITRFTGLAKSSQVGGPQTRKAQANIQSRDPSGLVCIRILNSLRSCPESLAH